MVFGRKRQELKVCLDVTDGITALKLRIILNGKKAGIDTVRSAINHARKKEPVDVRVTWEHGDIHRLVIEAVADGVRRLVAGGGDGTVNEIVNALLTLSVQDRPELAVLPLGTANDFATACGIPSNSNAALALAQSGHATTIDAARANEHIFINVASGGFGAQVTTNTPVALKNFLGGGAYTLAGVAQAVNFTPYKGQMRIPGDKVFDGEVIVAAVCNGRQAGGGKKLAPLARIDDGLLDVVGLRSFPASALPKVINELTDPGVDGDYVVRLKVPWVEWESDVDIPINLDGEPIKTRKVRFEVIPDAVKLVLPEETPIIASPGKMP